MTDPIAVPSAGEPAWEGVITDTKLEQVIGGLLVPNQAFSKALAIALRDARKQFAELLKQRDQLGKLARDPDWVAAPDDITPKQFAAQGGRYFDREGLIHGSAGGEPDGECYLWVLPNPAVAPVSEWISVEERLPEDRVEVLACIGSLVCAAWLDHDDAPPQWISEGDEVSGITHWMPLPAPPAREA